MSPWKHARTRAITRWTLAGAVAFARYYAPRNFYGAVRLAEWASRRALTGRPRGRRVKG